MTSESSKSSWLLVLLPALILLAIIIIIYATIGLEDANDIIDDFKQALRKSAKTRGTTK